MAHHIPFDNFPTLPDRVAAIRTLQRGNTQLFAVREDSVFAAPFNSLRQWTRTRPLPVAPPVEFCGQLRGHQQTIAADALRHIQTSTTPSVLFTLYCGAGKTVIILWLLCRLGLPALVFVPKRVLIDQWRARIRQFCPGLQFAVQTPRTPITGDWPVLVLDEVHQLFTPTHLHGILNVTPHILIGATATPWRSDELDVFDLFFDRRINLTRPPIACSVLIVATGLTPAVGSTAGRLDWNSLLNWQASHDARNALIVEVCRECPTPQLILTKRIEAATAIAQALGPTAQMISATSSGAVDPATQYIVATFSKLGTGFDHATLRTLILASDVLEYFEQYAGRILRTSATAALFVEIIDDFGPLWAHYRERAKLYASLGATVKKRGVGRWL